jgi:hypothetical protein
MVSGQLHAPAVLPPVLTGYEAGWVPEPVWIVWSTEKNCPCRESNPSRPARTYSD